MRTARSYLVSTHRWLGLTVGIIGVWLALTGAWLIFRPQLDTAVSPYLTLSQPCARPLPLHSIVEAALGAYADSPAESVWLKADPAAATIVRFKDSNQAYVDGCTGRVLGLHHRYSGVFGYAEYLHRLRFLPTTELSEWIGGTAAAVMAFLLAGMGFYLWFPRRKAAVRPSMTINSALKGRARMRNQHTVIGAAVAFAIFVIAGTGVPQAFKPVEAALFPLTGSKPTPKLQGSWPGLTPAGLDAAWSATVSRLGGQPRSATVRLPAKGKAIEIYLNEWSSPHPLARTYFYANPASGAVIRQLPYVAAPAGEKAYYWMLALHEVLIGGVVGQVLVLLALLAVPYLAFTGVRGWWLRNRTLRTPADRPEAMALTVLSARDEGPDVRVLELGLAGRGKLPAFEAGGHIEVTAPGGLVRHYSLVNGPDHAGAYEIAVRRAPDGRGGSIAMHMVKEGDQLAVSGPRCHFALDPKARFSVLIGAGIGITPMISMARHLAASGKPFVLLYFGRNAAAMPYRSLVAEEFGQRCQIYAGLSRDAVRTAIAAALKAAPGGTHLYTCGPASFMEAVFGEGRAAGLKEAMLHREYFEASPELAAAPREAFELKLARSNRIVTVDADTSVLDVLCANGVSVPSSCEQGLCGNCLTRVVEGEVDHRDRFLSDAERARGDCMMVCVSRAKGKRLVVDA